MSPSIRPVCWLWIAHWRGRKGWWVVLLFCPSNYYITTVLIITRKTYWLIAHTTFHLLRYSRLNPHRWQRKIMREFLMWILDHPLYSSYWKRRGGTDHVFTMSHDFGGCMQFKDLKEVGDILVPIFLYVFSSWPCWRIPQLPPSKYVRLYLYNLNVWTWSWSCRDF